MSSKSRVALLSVASNSSLVILKLIVGISTGAVSIISEAIHSATDLLAAVIAYFSVKNSDKPADKEHPYGHGKIENVSGVVEAILILGAAVWIILESVHKILNPKELETSLFVWGFGLMVLSAVVNIFVSRVLYRVAKREDSVALAADALHLKADVVTSLGVGLGLGVIWTGSLVGWQLSFLDPIIAILVALFISKEAIELMMSAFQPLLDHSIPDSERSQVEEVLVKYEVVGGSYHDLRTRRSGKFRHIDFHLTLPSNMTIAESHKICDDIEHEIEAKLGSVIVMIHVEPLGTT